MIDELLEYITSDGIVTKHLLVRNTDPRGLVIILPGANNISERPILHLTRKGLLEKGYDTLNINYEGVVDFSLNREALFSRLINLVEGVIDNYFELYGTVEISIIGRSLGSVITAMMCSQNKYNFNKVVLFSPTKITIEALKNKVCLIFTSYEDKYMDAVTIQMLKEWKEVDLHLCDGADHNLEVDGDMEKTIDILRDVVKRSVDYICN